MKKLELTPRIKCGKCRACLVYDSNADDNVFDDRGWPVLMNMKTEDSKNSIKYRFFKCMAKSINPNYSYNSRLIQTHQQ